MGPDRLADAKAISLWKAAGTPLDEIRIAFWIRVETQQACSLAGGGKDH
jgi:hypothetical protein